MKRFCPTVFHIFRIKLTFSVFVLSLLSTNLGAEIIDRGAFITDTQTGLDWLKVTSSAGLSYNEVSSRMGAGEAYDGWRYATGTDFNALLNNAGGIPDCSPNYCGVSEANNGVFRPLIDLLGDTDPEMRGVTYGILGAPGSISGTHWRAIIDDLYEEPPGESIADYAHTYYRTFDDTSSLSYLGSFLVRPSQSGAPRQIPIFGPLGLVAAIILVLGVALLNMRRFS